MIGSHLSNEIKRKTRARDIRPGSPGRRRRRLSIAVIVNVTIMRHSLVPRVGGDAK